MTIKQTTCCLKSLAEKVEEINGLRLGHENPRSSRNTLVYTSMRKRATFCPTSRYYAYYGNGHLRAVTIAVTAPHLLLLVLIHATTQ